jgi:predicted GNAT superfamily acetyltransferase
MSITIRPLTTLAECAHFQKVEQLVWGTDEEGMMPTHVLITLAQNGGLVMGAFAPDGPAATGGMVGIVGGWLGSGHAPGSTAGAPEQLKFCSHMAGVLTRWQRQRVGLRLKLAQREWVLAQGLTEWITWTYDPLFRPNAAFNIHRLGATCATYVRDLYGEMTDVLNAGGPSDRFKVDWWVRSPRVVDAVARAAVALTDTEPATDASRDTAARATPDATHPMAQLRFPGLRVLASVPAGAFRAPPTAPLVLDGAPLALPIPDDIAALRRADRGLALAWRHTVRAQMEAAFAAGYTVVDCLHIDGRQWCYILTRDDPTA